MGPKVKEEKAKPLHSPLLSRLLPPPHFFFLLLPWLLISLQNPILSQCHHTPVIFSFGDSNSDTSNLVSGFSFPINFPNGRTIFCKSTGCLSDRRLIIDLLCKSPHPTTTLDSHFFFQCGEWEGGFLGRAGSCRRRWRGRGAFPTARDNKRGLFYRGWGSCRRGTTTVEKKN